MSYRSTRSVNAFDESEAEIADCSSILKDLGGSSLGYTKVVTVSDVAECSSIVLVFLMDGGRERTKDIF